MSYSAITLPHDFMAAYSAIPLKVYDSNYDQVSQYKYIINAIYDTELVTASQPYSYQSNIFTELTTSNAHNYKVGETIILNDAANNNLQTGYYNIILVPDNTHIVIDLFPSINFVVFPIRISRFYKWKLTPDQQGYGKLDMSNVMKDLVTQNLTGESINYALDYEGPNTRKCFGLLCGSESQYVFEFEDNYFMSGGTVGFQNSAITSLVGIPFQVGDVIQIQQNQVAWGYNTITNDGFGFARYNSSQQHSFLGGQPLQVQGQTAIQFYNGNTSVKPLPVPTTTSLSTYQNFQGNSSTPGYIYGIPRPSYNTTAVITSLSVHPTFGVIIGTNIAYAGSSVPISGTIKFTGNQLQTTLNQYTDYEAFCVFNAHINRNEYSITAFDPYVVQNRLSTKNNLSTILGQSNTYRIEPSTIGWLLGHSQPASVLDGVRYTFYNTAGGTLGSVILPKPISSQLDVYYPIGLQQIAGSNYTDYVNTFSSYSGNVNNYCIYGYDAPFGTPGQRTNEICFEMNGDCSMYEIYHLMWKDKLGSFISYPFIYISRDFIESQKQSYYQQEGTWEYDTFGYDQYGVGEKNFYQRSRESFTLNSGWLYEFERELIKDLIQSPSVYIQTPNNELYSCHIDQDKLEIYKNINEQLFSYTFNVRVSNNEFRF